MSVNGEEAGFSYSGKEVLDEQKVLTKYNRFILKQFARYIQDNDNVLDFGAGIGTFARLVKREGVNLHCIEKDGQQMEYLKENGFSCSAELPEKRDFYDVVYSINVLEHIEDDRAVLDEIRGILKPGGILVLWVPAFQILYSSFDRRVGHLRRYSRKGLKKKVAESGYDIKRLKYSDSLGWFVTLLFKLIGSRKGRINRKVLLFYSNFLLPISILMDRVLSPFIGKNLIVIAEKPE